MSEQNILEKKDTPNLMKKSVVLLIFFCRTFLMLILNICLEVASIILEIFKELLFVDFCCKRTYSNFLLSLSICIFYWRSK